MEIIAYSNELTPMPWEGDVAAGDSGSPVRAGKHRPENRMPCSRAKTWIQTWGKVGIKEARAAPRPERARLATPR